MKRYYLILLLTFLWTTSFAQKSIRHDKAVQELIKSGLDKTYNFEFDAAELKYAEVKKRYPHNPAYALLMAINLYWEMLVNNSYKEKNTTYLSYLNTSLKQAEKMLEKDKNDFEGIFFSLSVHSSLALHHAQQSDHMKALGAAKKAYEYMRQGFKYKDEFGEFYYSSGLYDYFVVQYPESHPVYKPFMVFFADGNKARGVKELEHAAENATYTGTEATYFLSHIYLKYENRPLNALKYTIPLAEKYPRNLYYFTRHVEALVLTGKYEEAEKLNLTLYKSGKKFFEMSSYIFYGMIYEKQKNKLDQARSYYLKALEIFKSGDIQIKDYVGYIYAGLARVANKKGDKVKAKEYYKKALDVSDYTSVIKEAKIYLDK